MDNSIQISKGVFLYCKKEYPATLLEFNSCSMIVYHKDGNMFIDYNTSSFYKKDGEENEAK